MFIFSRELTENIQSLNRHLYKVFGIQQLVVCIEELAELQQAISKMVRNPNDENKNNLIEEIGDVLIVLNGLIDEYDLCTRDIEKTMEYKIHRTKNRLNL